MAEKLTYEELKSRVVQLEKKISEIICVERDTTDRKSAEEKLKESESLYRLTLSNVHDTEVLTDEEGNYTFCCPNVGFITEYSDRELMRTGNVKVLIGDAFFDDYNPLEKENIQNIETTITSKTGVVRNVLIGVKRIDFKGSSRLYTIHDVTEIKDLQKRLAQSQKMESIGSLAGGIAHDFNNLLFPIIGIAEMLMEDFSDNSIEYQSIREIYQAGKRGADLVKQILTFSRQAEHMVIPLKVQTILEDSLNLCRSKIPANISIHVDIRKDCGCVKCDPTRLQQIILNLVTNAYHAVESAGGQISITLKE